MRVVGTLLLLQSTRDILSAYPGDLAASSLIAEVSDQGDEFARVGGLSSDIIGRVIGICARECLTTGNWGIGVQGEDFFNAIMVGWVDNSRHIEVGSTCVTVEAKFTQHAGNVCCTVGNGVEVANPSCWEGLVCGPRALDFEFGNGRKGILWGKVYGAIGVVLVDEVD